tara:strand:+ start:4944 stop:5318 length:375 start_codon:yes stop_codon:yes gene_type:complete
MKYFLFILLFYIEYISEVTSFVPNINACSNNVNVLHKSLTLLQATIYNKKFIIPQVNNSKKNRWEPPVGYVPERLKKRYEINNLEKKNILCSNKNTTDMCTNEKKNLEIEIEIDKILIKIEKLN